ncbi:hypothetical protein GGX14DRAFT_669270 [Mycena pura]|uniref:Carbohydrate esterase family 16 protein n=1 Tax=Mycena pura TaxID=153505 RepID=A0AAD6VVK5_9AGAR|nr:hypothetical protein GGX14DRAFT_669270 [Mycena pura]
MALFPLISCALTLSGGVWAMSATKAVVLFGDSYTDQSRGDSIANGTFPGKDYTARRFFHRYEHDAINARMRTEFIQFHCQEDNAADVITVPLICEHMSVTRSGIKPRRTPQAKNVPDVLGGQTDWFIQDHVVSGSTKQRLSIDPDEFVVIIYIGTNDVGRKTFITDSQSPNVSLADIAHCQLHALRRLHALGARHFILNSMIPLQLTKLYSNSSDPSIYSPTPHDGPTWHRRMFNFRRRGSARGVGHSATVHMFDTYGFFEEMYNHPGQFFNGSIPANVTGHCNQCNPNNATQCTSCPRAERDSFMWWDELHPSEQTGRNLGREMFEALRRHSKYLS